jgi:hypothetical protein
MIPSWPKRGVWSAKPFKDTFCRCLVATSITAIWELPATNPVIVVMDVPPGDQAWVPERARAYDAWAEMVTGRWAQVVNLANAG